MDATWGEEERFFSICLRARYCSRLSAWRPAIDRYAVRRSNGRRGPDPSHRRRQTQKHNAEQKKLKLIKVRNYHSILIFFLFFSFTNPNLRTEKKMTTIHENYQLCWTNGDILDLTKKKEGPQQGWELLRQY